MDTMEWTKIVGGLCGSLLVFLLIEWGAQSIFHDNHHTEHGSYNSSEKIADVSETIKSDDTDDIPFIELVATADSKKGKKVFGKCKSCHKLGDGENGIGPHLFQVIDRKVASVSDFDYSNALLEIAGNWDVENLGLFLENPKKYASGTKMNFSGLKKSKDRANLVKYLSEVND